MNSLFQRTLAVDLRPAMVRSSGGNLDSLYELRQFRKLRDWTLRTMKNYIFTLHISVDDFVNH